ncbi:MAG: hypothetical protein KGJ59_11405 [Bacteroidota bacterium]|nr:hypothetical protein [Bacteroidota bacterium]
MKRITTIFLLLSFLAFIQSALAQHRGGKKGEPPFARLENFKKIKMMETLHLDETTSIRFFSRYDKHEEQMRAFGEERDRIAKQLDSLSRNNAPDEAYDAAFDQLLSIDKKIAREHADFLSSLKEILSNKQIAEYIVFERNFIRDLRRIVREVQMDRMQPR